MMHQDFGFPVDSEAVNTDVIWNKVLADQHARYTETMKTYPELATGIHSGDDNEGDDDDEEEGGKKKRSKFKSKTSKFPISSEYIVGISRNDNGISNNNATADQGQRCLEYAIKRIAYNILEACTENAFGIRPEKLVAIQEKWSEEVIRVCINYCMQVRAAEGGKTDGDLLPGMTARGLNLLCSWGHENSLPLANIYGSSGFDRLNAILLAIRRVPVLYIDIKSNILFGGFRSRTLVVGEASVRLTNNTSLISQLTIEQSCCDINWVAIQRNVGQKVMKKWVLLVYYIMTLAMVEVDAPTNYKQPVNDLLRMLSTASTASDILTQILNLITSLHTDTSITNEEEEFTIKIAKEKTDITDAVTSAITHFCAQQEKDEVMSRLRIENRSREMFLMFVLDTFSTLREAKEGTNVTQILTDEITTLYNYSVGEQQKDQLQMQQGFGSQLVNIQVDEFFSSAEQLLAAINQSIASKSRDGARALLVDAQTHKDKLLDDAERLLGDQVPLRLKNNIQSVRENIVENWNKLESLAGYLGEKWDEGTQMLATHKQFFDSYHNDDEWDKALTKEQHEVYVEAMLVAGGGTKSRKRRPRRRRKTRRKKKRRKRKTIKRRRKRGRKTRRK